MGVFAHRPTLEVLMGSYFYICNHCDWPFEGRDTESDAWADGVEHYNNTNHEGGEVKIFDGAGYSDAEVHARDHEHHSHERHGHHSHSHEQHGHEEPHIF
jgi:hypothetical protein